MIADHLIGIERFEADLWKVADNLRANSNLASNEYFMPILGLIFLRQATNRYHSALAAIKEDKAAGRIPERPLIEAGAVDVMIDIRGNFFYTRTVPCQLWFFDRAKEQDPVRADRVLMLDARNIYRTVSRAIYDFNPEQQKNIAAIVWLYREQSDRFLGLVESYLAQALSEGQATAEPLEAFDGALGKQIDLAGTLAGRAVEVAVKQLEARESDIWANSEINRAHKALEDARHGAVVPLRRARYFVRQADWLQERFPDAELRDVEGLVKLVDRAEIDAHDWSLTPGRYVGVAPEEEDEDFDFEEAMGAIHAELEELDAKAATLAVTIRKNFEALGI